VTTSNTETAHQAWQQNWATESGRAHWLEPEPDVIAAAASLPQQKTLPVLDLGCGVGRHALYLAQQGFKVSACDASPQGIEITAQQAQQRNLSLGLSEARMTDLPYRDGQFAYVLAWNVIYHGDPTVVRQTIAEIQRVLRPGGLYQGTMLSKRNEGYNKGRQVAPNTFVRQDGGADGDKTHPHFYADAAEITSLFSQFDIISLTDREQRFPGSQHWSLVAERLS
jgi:2-polyprenyl-3-methyl-5-hydroxy-6-metoxy-1,4-benzoquinol methylase